ncbi:MAG: hypothetical protein DWQ36_22035 [Acidobacteria bacterium]|nr:MAG: hypothetical protein DWQ30_00505 [Acidobacteriota bacterium]REK00869.1 MAG: hypothetical protein DWQ36_22035 [Acidobacteriota bacterium]
MDLDRFCALRTHQYHLTARSNLERILEQRLLVPAATTLTHGGHPIDQRRRESIVVRTPVGEVHVRDQGPLHEGNMRLGDGWDLARFVAWVNRHVFFWPGNDEKPIAHGLRHFQRYEAESPVVLRVPTRALLDANPDLAPRFARHNSGAPRWSGGKASPRGARTYLPASQIDVTPGRVVEMVFEGAVRLPEGSGVEVLRGPWANGEGSVIRR